MRFKLFFIMVAVLVFIGLISGCAPEGACYYDTECPGCGDDFTTTIVRYCYNGLHEDSCHDSCGYSASSCEWNSVFVADECCQYSMCDTILNPEDCWPE